MKTNLKEHNVPVYEKLENMMTEKNKALVVTATGTGKSYLTLEYITRHNLNTLVVVPRLSIGREWDKMSKKISTITYQSFTRTQDFDKYDCVVFDEVYHAGATTWIGPIWNFMRNTDKKIIGLTADPKRYSDGARDMGEYLFNGCRVDGYSLTTAIEQEILPKLTYVAAMWDANGIRERYIDKEIPTPLLARFNYALDKRKPVEEIVSEHMPKGARKGIIFVETIPACKEAKEFINGIYPDAQTWTIHSLQSSRLNEEYHNEFKKAKEGYMIAVDMYNEGLHAPGVNTIIMLRRTSSPTIFYQQIGRALHVGSVKDPIVFDLACNSGLLKIKGSQRDRQRGIATITKYIPTVSTQTVLYDYTKDILDVIEQIDNMLDLSWTDDENEILKTYYPTEGIEVAKRLPGRSVSAIMTRAYVLKIGSNVKNEWTDEEDEILRQYYSAEGRNVNKRLPGRTKLACACRAQKLGLASIHGAWTDKEIDILKKYYPKEGVNVLKRLPGRSETALFSKISKLGIVCKNPKWSEKEDTIIREYYPIEGPDTYKRLSGRSKQSTKTRAKTLGVKTIKGSAWSDEELEIARRFYPVEGVDVLKRLPGRTKYVLDHQLKNIGIVKGDKK